MDLVSHGFWAGTAAKVANKKLKTPLRLPQIIFWGIFPDLFAFTIFFVWLVLQFIFGGMTFSTLPHHMRLPTLGEPVPADTSPIFWWTAFLYQLSHSVFVFFLVFGILFLILKRPVWELSGWLFHILIDIPTHSYQFYPTPFLWPISNWMFHGLSWGTPWFLVLNYLAMLIVFFLFWRRKKKSAS